MLSYVMLIKWTQAGIEKVKDTPQRVELTRKTFKSVSGNLKEFYFVFRKYDMIAIAGGSERRGNGESGTHYRGPRGGKHRDLEGVFGSRRI
ncbi:MAG: GYD domain-containing protein [Halobacteriota archaeon]